MCHVGAAVFGTWIYPSNRSYQWKHLKVQSLYSFYDLLLYVSICRKTGTIYAKIEVNFSSIQVAQDDHNPQS